MANGEDTTKAPSEVTIHYQKSPQFHVVHADGVIGGSTPNGQYVYVAVYSERLPIPTTVTHSVTEVSAQGVKMGEVLAKEGKSGILRELEVGAYFSRDAAVAFHGWLGKTLGLDK